MPLSRLIPNMVTMLGMCCGLSALRFALQGNYEVAVGMIVAAAIIDGMDGRIARFLNATSTFGAQLDSLSDFLCFGVVPALVMYQWNLHDVKGFGWAAVLFYAVCCALRLARFNTNLIEDEDALHPWRAKFFVGIPSPAGGMLCLLPLVTSFDGSYLQRYPFLDMMWVTLVGALMASRIPTFAVKKIRIHHEWVLPVMLLFLIGMVITLVQPWFMFTLAGMLYVCTIPLSVMRYRKLSRIHTITVVSQGGSSSPESSPQGVAK